MTTCWLWLLYDVWHAMDWNLAGSQAVCQSHSMKHIPASLHLPDNEALLQTQVSTLDTFTWFVLVMPPHTTASVRIPSCFQVHYMLWQTSSVQFWAVKSFSLDLQQSAEDPPVHSRQTFAIKHKHPDITFDILHQTTSSSLQLQFTVT